MLGAVRSLPVDIVEHPGGIRIAGLTPGLVRKLLARRLGAAQVEAAEIHQEPCACALKSALVPGGGKAWWRAVMAHTPFGASCVQDQWPYLGAMCRACASQDAPRRPARMDIECFYLMRTGTWGKAMRKMETRALAVDHIHASPGRRAAIWNAYLTSPCPLSRTRDRAGPDY